VVDDNIITGSSANQSVMLANLHKLEDSGKLSSPKGDVKDIVTSIISAANRKMLRTGTKGKKESLTDLEGRDSRQDGQAESRRESESVIHGALQIASAVPGLVGSISSNSVPGSHSSSGGSGSHTPPTDQLRQSYSRQNSRNSVSSELQLKRRGSLPSSTSTSIQSKRNNISSYTSCSLSESLPVSDSNESKMALAMMQSDTEMATNGTGENQPIVCGKLSLVNLGTSQEHSTSSTSTNSSQQQQPSQTQYKFPIETYTGLEAATAERIAKFEAETKAMLTRAIPEQPLAATSSSIGTTCTTARLAYDAETQSDRPLTRSDSSLSSFGCNSAPPPRTTGGVGGLANIATSLTGSFNPVSSDLPLNPSSLSRSSNPVLESITTPVPQTNPLQGGILMQEPYETDAYDRCPGGGGAGVSGGDDEEALLTAVCAPYRVTVMPTSLNSLIETSASGSGRNSLAMHGDMLTVFDTNKVAKRGTLQRLKVRNKDVADDCGETIHEVSDVEMENEGESVLGKLSAKFDEKMRLLLDPDYCVQRYDSDPGDDDASLIDPIQQLILEAGTKKELDDVKNALLRDKANKKVELRRSARVDKTSQPETRRSVRQETTTTTEPKKSMIASTTQTTIAKHDQLQPQPPPQPQQQPVLRQVNNRSWKPLKRSDSLTKKEKTQLNLKTKEVEKENKVLKLKEHFEQNALRSRNFPNNPTNGSANNNPSNIDLNKVRKKFSDSRNRRIKRRHTVGGTKDFTENILSKMTQEKSKSSWDRLAPILSNQELTAATAAAAADSKQRRWWWGDEREERRRSLPDCAAAAGPDRPIESHV